MYKTTYFDIQVTTLDDALARINKIDMQWPSDAGRYLFLDVHYDRNLTHNKLVAAHDKLIKRTKNFERGVSINTLTEYYSKAIRYSNAKDYVSLRWATFWLFEEFSMILGLLNQKYYVAQGPTSKIAQIEQFKYKPEGWRRISEMLLSTNYKDNIDGANKLYNLCHKLSKKYKFANYQISSIKKIKFDK